MPSGRVRRMRKMALVAARDAANSLPSPAAPVVTPVVTPVAAPVVTPVAAPIKPVATTVAPEPAKPKLDQTPSKVKAHKKTNVKKDN